jgi:hypothetical protein
MVEEFGQQCGAFGHGGDGYIKPEPADLLRCAMQPDVLARDKNSAGIYPSLRRDS